jgi:hypothetical protein
VAADPPAFPPPPSPPPSQPAPGQAYSAPPPGAYAQPPGAYAQPPGAYAQPPGAYAQPPGGVQAVDLGAVLRRIPVNDALIGGALLLLFIFSFLQGWMYVKASTTCSFGYCYSGGGAFFDSLWDGFGVLPALLIVFGALWFAYRAIPQLRGSLVLPVPDAVIWMGFAITEAVFFLLQWVIVGASNGGVGYYIPGWADFCSIVFAAVIFVGAYRNYQHGPKLVFTSSRAPAAVTPLASAAPSPVPDAAGAVAVGTLTPDRSHWFDGTSWRSTSDSVPPTAPRSEDGFYWWDGTTWRPVPR